MLPVAHYLHLLLIIYPLPCLFPQVIDTNRTFVAWMQLLDKDVFTWITCLTSARAATDNQTANLVMLLFQGKVRALHHTRTQCRHMRRKQSRAEQVSIYIYIYIYTSYMCNRMQSARAYILHAALSVLLASLHMIHTPSINAASREHN